MPSADHRFLLRVPASLWSNLLCKATDAGQSVNDYVVTCIRERDIKPTAVVTSAASRDINSRKKPANTAKQASPTRLTTTPSPAAKWACPHGPPDCSHHPHAVRTHCGPCRVDAQEALQRARVAQDAAEAARVQPGAPLGLLEPF